MKTPTLKDITAARQTYETYEPRDLFYRVAIELVDLIFRGATSFSLSEALAVLLQAWNKPFYQYRPFNAKHFLDIEALVKKFLPDLQKFRERSIDSFDKKDESLVQELFQSFELYQVAVKGVLLRVSF